MGLKMKVALVMALALLLLPGVKFAKETADRYLV
jgi:hypothetical protein